MIKNNFLTKKINYCMLKNQAQKTPFCHLKRTDFYPTSVEELLSQRNSGDPILPENPDEVEGNQLLKFAARLAESSEFLGIRFSSTRFKKVLGNDYAGDIALVDTTKIAVPPEIIIIPKTQIGINGYCAIAVKSLPAT